MTPSPPCWNTFLICPVGERMREGSRIGIDPGTVRIGVARCDAPAVLAVPLVTVHAGGTAIGELAALAAQWEVIEVIVGLPLTLSGRVGPAAASATAFARELACEVAPVPVRLVDERLTTAASQKHLRQAGRNSRDSRKVQDQAAAVAILQNALDTERATGTPAGVAVDPIGSSEETT